MLGRPDAGASSPVDGAARRAVRPPASDSAGRGEARADGGHQKAAERALRRSVGPTAWAVLADLRVDAQPDNGALVVASSARRVAANLGIGKDTAARALRRLAAAQVLRRRPQGTDEVGRFSRGGYELHLDRWQLPPCPPETDAAGGSRTGIADTVRRAPGPGMVAGQRPSPRRRDGRDRAYGDQLCLLPTTANAGEAGTKARS